MTKFKHWTAAALIVLGCLTATLSVTVIWLHEVVIDTDKYVDTVAPLGQDPAIQNAIARKATDELFQNLDAQQRVQQALPDQAGFLAAPLVGATENFASRQVVDLMQTSEFETLWRQSNRAAHESVTRILLEQPGVISSQQGTVTVSLSELLNLVKARLAGRGVNIFENISVQPNSIRLTLFESTQLARFQSAVTLLNRLAFWLPVLALALWVIAAWLLRSPMKTAFWAGLGLSIGMAALLIGIAFARSQYLDVVATSKSIDLGAATSFFDIIAGSIKTAIRESFVFGLLIAAAGFVGGPFPSAVRMRTAGARWIRIAAGRAAPIAVGPAGAWIAAHVALIRAIAAALALIVLVIMNQPSLLDALIVAVVLGVFYLLLELLVRRTG